MSTLHPFQFDNIPLRGRVLRLHNLNEHVHTLHDCPPATTILLAQLLAAAALLMHDAKHSLNINIQVQNVSMKAMAFAHCTTAGHLKAFANEAMQNTDFATIGNLPDSHFAVTLEDPQNNMPPHQSLVGLHHPNASAALEHYFTTSVQTPTLFKVMTWEDNGDIHAGALFLQALPGLDADGDDWQRMGHLLNTLTPHELADPDYAAETLLLHLFSEDEIRLAKPEDFTLQADNPRPRMLAALATIPVENLQEMLAATGEIALTDQTSGKHETFTEADLQHILAADTTKH